jgi:hypothetical protein
VTAAGADVAGGPVTRAEVLARFAPTSTGGARAERPRAAEEIDVLLATDLLSEGLNLQDASVVVHLDLPWTAARLTQRLGRVWRMGSAQARVHEYAIAPPAPAEQMLRLTEILTAKAGAAALTEILTAKAGAAARSLGDAIAPLLAQRGVAEADTGSASCPDPHTAHELLRRLFHRWLAGVSELDGSSAPPDPTPRSGDEAIVAASVRAPFDGWIAAVTQGERPQVLAARRGGAVTTDPAIILEVARAAEGRPRIAAPSRVTRVMREIDAYVATQRAARDAGLAVVGSRAHAAASSRIASVAAGAPAHRRVAVSRLAAAARETVAASRTAGAERLLQALLADDSWAAATEDVAEQWLARVIEIGAAPTPNANASPQAAGEVVTVHALLLLVP